MKQSGPKKQKCGCVMEIIDYGLGIAFNMIHEQCAKHKAESTKRAKEALERRKREREKANKNGTPFY